MPMTAGDIADHLSGVLHGDKKILIQAPAGIADALPGTISFVAHPKYIEELYKTKASIVIIDKTLTLSKEVNISLIIVEDINLAVPKLLELFSPNQSQESRISNTSSIDTRAEIGSNVSIGDYTVIAQGASIQSGTFIYPQVYVAENVKIGQQCTIYPGVRLGRDTEVGDNVIIHANTVIGSDGFGFVRDGSGKYKKVPQLGNVVIEDNVEIGSNVVIDRATMGSTIIRNGVKLDNLIQVGHNVEIKENTVIAAQTGIAGSSTVGANSRIGGQVGIVGHIQLADGIEVQAQSGVAANIKDANSKWYGSPAIDYRSYLKSFVIFKKLPKILKELNKVKKQVAYLLKARDGQDI